MLNRQKTLEGILSSFTKVVEDLRVLQLQNNEKVDRNQAAIDRLMAQNTSLSTEASRAKTIEENITKLLS